MCYISKEDLSDAIKIIGRSKAKLAISLKEKLDTASYYESRYALVDNGYIYQTNCLLTLDCMNGCSGSEYYINGKTKELIHRFSYIDYENSIPDDISYKEDEPKVLGHVIAERETLEEFIDAYELNINGFIGVDKGVYKVIKRFENKDIIGNRIKRD